MAYWTAYITGAAPHVVTEQLLHLGDRNGGPSGRNLSLAALAGYAAGAAVYFALAAVPP